MQIRLLVAVIAAFAFILVSAPAANAHLDIDWPAMAGVNQKAYPCGAIGQEAAPTKHTFRPGQTITVRYTETIGHEGNFRAAFAPTLADLDAPIGCGDIRPLGPDDGNANMTILADGFNLSPSANDTAMGCPGRVGDRVATSGVPYTIDVTLPNVECTDCYLQMIQFMTDKPPLDPDPNLTGIGQVPATNGGNDLYFRCAMVTLTNDPGAVISTDPEANGGDVDAGPNDPDAGNGNAGNDAGVGGNGPVGGDAGCGCQSSSSGGGALLLLFVAALWWRRPRRALQRK
jgi:MYXO-CTERM domain-containing protein